MASLRMLARSLLLVASFAPSAITQSSDTTATSSSSLVIITPSSVPIPSGPYQSYASQMNGITTRPDASSTGTSSGATGSSSSLGSMHRNATMSTTSNTLLLQGSNRPTPSSNSTKTSTAAGPPPMNTQACNNYPEFCSKRYMNFTEVCAHNSAFTTPNNAARNQDVAILGQLNDGVRMIQGETHMQNGTLYSCHNSCNILNAGPLENELATVREWISVHPYDVVTILLVNSDYVSVDQYVDPIMNAGLGPYLYEPPKIPMHREDWPIMSDIILSGKRVLIFMDYNANQTQVPYIMDEFSQMWETPFSPTDVNFPCTQQRPPGLNSEQQALVPYLANHNLNVQINLGSANLLIPNFAEIGVVNADNSSTGSLHTMAQNCTAMWGRPPAWLLVDFYNVGSGSVFEVAARLNNVTYNRSCCGRDVSLSSASSIFASRTSFSAVIVASLLGFVFLL